MKSMYGNGADQEWALMNKARGRYTPPPPPNCPKCLYRTGQVVQKLLVFAALIPLLFFTACPNLNDEPDNPTVTGVTVSPTTATVAKGRTQQFTAAVSGDNNPAQTVTWTVEGGGTGTSISAGGLLSVGANETAATLTVKATSTVDTSKSGTASVTVSSSGQTPGVTVSPATPNVVKGTTQQFTATVSGTTAQTVTWTVEGGGDGTGISAGGLLSVGANETATTLTVKATSTADPSKFGTATVTVYASTDELPSVSNVTVSPTTATVPKGGTHQFTAVVSGTTAQTVTWTVEGNGDGTSISAGGLLSVGANETAASLTVRATSTVDPSKSGTASVTVEGEILTSIADVQAYLSAASGGGTAADPVSLNVQLDLGDTANGWTVLLDAIQTAGKFVALDLSASTLSGTEYDPGAANTGESKILSLVLPNGAASIKGGSNEINSSFKNFTALTSVSGSAVETIGDYAFASCASLTAVSFPAATDIGHFAFYDCDALTTVSLPAVSSIGEHAFRDCAALTTVSLPAVTSINYRAFASCTALTAVNLPATLTTISVNPFAGCINLATITVASGNPNYSAQNGMLLNKTGTTLIAYPGATGAVTLNTVSSIGSSAFQGCTSLTEVSLPAAVSIDSSVFTGCTSLAELSLPAATSIGHLAFYDCTSLTTVSLPAATDIDSSAFRGCTSLTEVSFPAATSIGYYAFENRTALTTVSLPAATDIGYNAFRNCTSLTTVSLPAATDIGGYAFQGCTSLTEVSFPAATDIGGYAFYSCNALTTVSLPAATDIGVAAFYSCTALTMVSLPAATSIGAQTFGFTGTDALTVTLGSTPPTLGDYMFANVNTAKTVTVKVPSSATGYGALPSTYSSTDSTPTWGNGFRGKGWNGSGFLSSGRINSRITVTIQAQ